MKKEITSDDMVNDILAAKPEQESDDMANQVLEEKPIEIAAPVENKPRFSQLESAGLGAVQGATFGFGDEIEAFVKSALTAGASYDQIVKEVRDRNKQAQTENPWSYGGGEVASAVATSFIPGLGALNIGKGAKLAEIAGKSALQGGLMGAGTSEASGTELLADTAKGAGMGAAVGTTLNSLGKIAGRAPGVFGRVEDQQAFKLVGAPPEAIKKGVKLDGFNDTFADEAKRVIAPRISQSTERVQQRMTEIGNEKASALHEAAELLKRNKGPAAADLEKTSFLNDKNNLLAGKNVELQNRAISAAEKANVQKNIDDVGKFIDDQIANTSFHDLGSLEKLRSLLREETSTYQTQFKINPSLIDANVREKLFDGLHGLLTTKIETMANSVGNKVGSKVKDLNMRMNHQYDIRDGLVDALIKEKTGNSNFLSWATLGVGGVPALLGKFAAEAIFDIPAARAARYGGYALAKKLNKITPSTPVGQELTNPIAEGLTRKAVSNFSSPSEAQGEPYVNQEPLPPTEQTKVSSPETHNIPVEELHASLSSDPELQEKLVSNPKLKNMIQYIALQRPKSRQQLMNRGTDNGTFVG